MNSSFEHMTFVRIFAGVYCKS